MNADFVYGTIGEYFPCILYDLTWDFPEFVETTNTIDLGLYSQRHSKHSNDFLFRISSNL